MSKFKIGDRVTVHNSDSKHNERVGEVVGYFDKGTGEQLPMLDIAGWTDRTFFADTELELVEPVVEYEYAVLFTFGKIQRTLRPEDWTAIDNAVVRFNNTGRTGIDPVWGEWTAKLVKRRKAGRIEDV